MPFFNLVKYRIYAQLYSESKRTYLSFFWWIFEPLFLFITYYVVFHLLLNFKGEYFIFKIFAGVVVWQWFNRSVINASTSILSSGTILRLVPISKFFFPIVSIMTDMIKSLVVFVVLMVLVLFYNNTFGIQWLSLPYLFVTELLLIYTFGLWSALLTPFIPDLKILIATLMLALMFASGVFYDPSKLSPQIQEYFFMNPIALTIHSFREVFIYGHWPPFKMLLVFNLISVVLIYFAYVFERKYSNHYLRLVVV